MLDNIIGKWKQSSGSVVQGKFKGQSWLKVIDETCQGQFATSQWCQGHITGSTLRVADRWSIDNNGR